MSELLTKSDVLREKGWSYEFLTALIEEAHIPSYKVGNRKYYTIDDVEAGLSSRRDQWESTKKKAHRIGNTTSPFKGKGIGAARRLKKEAKHRQSTPNAEARPS